MKGFSLLELLIALGLGLLVLMGVVTIYHTQTQTYKQAEALSRLQEKGRVIESLLRADFRSAGYLGCMHLRSKLNLKNKPKGLQAYGVGPGLSIQRMSILTADVLSEIKEDSPQLLISFLPRLKPKQTLIVANCHKADFFKLKRFSTRKGKLLLQSETPLRAYAKGAYLGVFEQASYEIRETRRKNERGDKIRAIYRINTKGYPYELLEGIDQMAVHYGVHAEEGNALSWRQANEVQDWRQVKMLNIHLLLSSIDRVLEKPAPVFFEGVALGYSDRHLHLDWQMDIALRNYS